MLTFILHLVQFRGGFLFHFWLLSSGPLWVVTIIKERLEVNKIGQLSTEKWILKSAFDLLLTSFL